MSDSGPRSWDELVDALRAAASDVRGALGSSRSPSAVEEAASARLKDDVSRLQQNANDLLSKLSTALEQQRSEIASSFDRERAERSADQMKASLQELASLASNVTASTASAAGSSLEHAEPELKSAMRSLEDVAGSAASWIRATVDPPRDRPGDGASRKEPPLDDM